MPLLMKPFGLVFGAAVMGGWADSALAESQADMIAQMQEQVRAKVQPARDYFFFTCVDEYLRLHNSPNFDTSSREAARSLEIPAEMIAGLADQARIAARSISPQSADSGDKSQSAVLLKCLGASRDLVFSIPLVAAPRQ